MTDLNRQLVRWFLVLFLAGLLGAAVGIWIITKLGLPL